MVMRAELGSELGKRGKLRADHKPCALASP